MKKVHFLLAAMLVLPVFFSCEEIENPDNPDDPSNPSTPEDPQEPELQLEFRRTFRFDGNVVSSNGDGDFVAVLKPSLYVTKSADDHKIVTGRYKFDNNTKTWTYTNVGKLELLDNGKIAFTPSEGESRIFDCETTEIVSDGESNAGKMNGSWKIKETILDFRGANYTFDGLDLNEVEKIARDQGIVFKFHMNDNMVAKKVLITDSLMAADFENGESYAAEHSLRLGSEFTLSEYTNGLEGTAKVSFVDELCVITIDTKLDESPAKIRLTLQKAN